MIGQEQGRQLALPQNAGASSSLLRERDMVFEQSASLYSIYDMLTIS